MKFHNRSIRYRETWTKVETKDFFISAVDDPFMLDARHLWCLRHPSDGRFYGQWHNWLFEKPEDALAFKLVFG